MKRSIVFFLIFCLFAATSAFAGAGHDHGSAHKINQEQAGKQAAIIVEKLAQAGKLETSWNSLSPTEVHQKKFGDSTEWVVTFHNPQVKDQEKQTLYVFLSPAGKYIAANYTGK